MRRSDDILAALLGVDRGGARPGSNEAGREGRRAARVLRAPSGPGRYLLAVVASMAATALTLAFYDFLSRSIFVFFLLAVLVTALFGGLGPGVLATVVGAVAAAYVVVPPRRSFAIPAADWALIGMFLSLALVVVALSHWLVAAQRRAAARERALRRRDRIMNAVGLGAERLLRSTESRHLDEFLGLLGKATRVSRVYIFRNELDARGGLVASQRFEWVAPGVSPQIGRPELQGRPYNGGGMARWRAVLGAGQPVLGPVAEFPASERELLESQGIRSIIVLPIFIGEEWWGFMGFDETRYERRWSSIEVDALRMAAGLVGATIERRRAEANVRQLEREHAARGVAEAAAQRSRFLASASAVLASMLDYQATFRTLARLAVPELADWCIVDVLEDGEVRRVAVVAADPALNGLAEAIRRRPPVRGSASPIRRVLDSGEPRLYTEVTAATIRELGAGPEYTERLRELRPRSAIVVPLRARGRVVGVITLVATVSDRRYGRDDLALAEDLAGRAALALENARLYMEAREATRIRDDVLAVVSHDLRNPLNTISLSAGVLSDVVGEREPAARQQLEIITRSIERANRLIGDLLDVARMEAGRLTVEAKRVSSVEVAREAIELHRSLTAERGQRLVAKLPERLPDVCADHDRLLQVFSNVLGNAIKFTPKGGRIELGAEVEDGAVRFHVADTGPGILAEDLPRLFDPFWQATRAKGEGAGLGLAISRGLVEAHGGLIRAESEVGVGTTVSFTIPTAAAKAEAKAEAKAAAKAAAKAKAEAAEAAAREGGEAPEAPPSGRDEGSRRGGGGPPASQAAD